MNQKENDRMSLREQAAISRRAVRTLWSLNPLYTVCLFVRPLLETLGAYIPVYFSAKLVDALIERESAPVLARYVVYAVLPVFLFALIQAFAARYRIRNPFSPSSVRTGNSRIKRWSSHTKSSKTRKSNV